MSEEPDGEDVEAESSADIEAEQTEDVETEPEGEETEPEAEEGGLQDDDFVRLDYTARTVEGGQLVDTTDPEVAEEEGIDDEEHTFEPRIILLGAGHIFEAVEEDIVGGEVGQTGTVVVPAAEAFGEYDESEVRTVSTSKIPEDDRYPGAHVDVDGEHGHVETIIGGRARVDFNHPLAGEDIEYEYEVVDHVEDRLEQAEGLLGMYIDADLDMRFQTDEVEEEQLVEVDEEELEEGEEPPEPETETVSVEKETLYIESTPQLAFNQEWMFQKQQIGQQLIDHLGIDRVVIEEVIEGQGGMMGGLGGMMGGAPGGADLEDVEDIDAEELVEELEDVEE